MSKIFKDKIKRLTNEELIEIKNNLDTLFKQFLIKSYLPFFMEDKKDNGDIDYFILVKKWYKIQDIENSLIKWWFKIEEKYKNDLEYTFLIKDIKKTEKLKTDIYYHLDIFFINDEILDSFKNHNINDLILESTKKEKDILEFILDNLIYEYYKIPFFSYHLWIILRKFWIKYSSKWVFYYLSHEETWLNDEYILITYDLKEFLYKFFNNYHFLSDKNNFVNEKNTMFYFNKDNFWFKYYENWWINSENQLVNFIELIKLYTYQFFDIKNLKYEEKRKLKAYKRNESINNKLVSNKINNLYKFFLENNLLEKDEISYFEKKWFDIFYFNKFWVSNKIKHKKINNYFEFWLSNDFDWFQNKLINVKNESLILKEKKKIKKELLNNYIEILKKKWINFQDEIKKWNEIIKNKLKKINIEAYKKAKINLLNK